MKIGKIGGFLVGLVVMFLSGYGEEVGAVDTCVDRGGICANALNDCVGMIILTDKFSDCEDGEDCCLPNCGGEGQPCCGPGICTRDNRCENGVCQKFKLTGNGVLCQTKDVKIGVNTALGCIPVEMKSFVTWLMPYLFGIAGGVSFLMMVMGFISIATSNGDPKAVAEASGKITSAITGLLVSIFAIFILRLIAVDILKIPGFN